MEFSEFIKLVLQVIGSVLAVVVFFKREMDGLKDELRKNIQKNAEDIRNIEKEFYSYKVEALEKFVKREDFEKLFVSIEELKALIIRGNKDGRAN